jgi:hypothetical protein
MSLKRRLLLPLFILLVCCLLWGSHSLAATYQWKDFRQPFRQTILLFGSDKEVTFFLPAEVFKQHDKIPLVVQTDDRVLEVPLFLQVNDQSLSQAYRLKQKSSPTVTNRILISKKYLKPGINRLRFATYSTHYVTWTIIGQIVGLRFDLSQPQKGAGALAKKPAALKQMSPPAAPAATAPRKDGRPPEITITSHDISRGIKPVVNQKEMVVAGRASDDSGVSEITVNGVHIAFGPAGNFAAQVRLQKGENRVVVCAVDIYGNRAEQIFTVVRGETAMRPPAVTSVDRAGKFYALIIGNDDYKYLQNLKTAKKDARAVEEMLHRQYKFQTRLLLDATRNDIIGAINHFRKMLKENDNFLIYYAGHGVFDTTVNKAYWLPVDAGSDEDTNWIIADRITSNVRRFSSRHVLIVSDSCYSGTLTRKATADLDSAHQRERYLQRMQRKKSRTLLASGGNEPVSDTGGGGHSIFARAFLSGLAEMETDMFSAEELYYRYIKEIVAGNSDQTPEYDIIRNSGHEGGEFVFQKRR